MALLKFGCLLLLLGQDSFVLAQTSVVELHEALGHLEEVLVGLERTELGIENKVTSRLDGCTLGLDSEGVLDPLLCRFVVSIQQFPVY